MHNRVTGDMLFYNLRAVGANDQYFSHHRRGGVVNYLVGSGAWSVIKNDDLYRLSVAFGP